MTEAEAMATLTGIAEAAGLYISLYLSVVFAYLTVSYFLGTALSRVQCSAITALYVLVASLMAITVVIHTRAFMVVAAAHQTVYREMWLVIAPDWELGAWSFCVSGILLSLYFMYNVRRTARAESSG